MVETNTLILIPINKRKNVVISFEKDFFKLMNNSAYGKTMKNLRKRVKVRLVSSAKDYNRWVSRLCFVLQEIFSRNFVAIHEIRHVLTLYKPVYIGFSILDLSNLIMYEFH